MTIKKMMMALIAILPLLFAFTVQGSAETLPQTSTPPPATTPIATDDATATTQVSQNITINGTVQTPSGNPLPAGLEVHLQGMDGMKSSLAVDVTAPVKADGTFEFKDVKYVTGRVFYAYIKSGGLTFPSDVLHGADITPGQPMTLNIVYYETTQDTSKLNADRVHVFFDFSVPGKLQVVEMYVLSNGDKRISLPAEGQPLFTITLPQGAANLQVETQGKDELFKVNPNSLAYLGPVYPGTPPTQLLFAYDLPYPENKTIVKWTPSLPVTSIIFGVPHEGVKLTAPGLEDNGVRDVQGMAFKLYSGENLPAGQPVELQLSGVPSAAPVATPATAISTTNNTLVAIIGGLGLLLILMGAFIWYYRKRQSGPANGVDDATEPVEDKPYVPESEEELLDAIVALDDLQQSGRISPEAYTERRTILKEHLRAKRMHN